MLFGGVHKATLEGIQVNFFVSNTIHFLKFCCCSCVAISMFVLSAIHRHLNLRFVFVIVAITLLYH
jgi:hypothetical protein